MLFAQLACSEALGSQFDRKLENWQEAFLLCAILNDSLPNITNTSCRCLHWDGKKQRSSDIRGKGAQPRFQQSSTNQELSEKSRFDPLIPVSNGNKEKPKPALTGGSSCCRETQFAAREGRARYLIRRADVIGITVPGAARGGIQWGLWDTVTCRQDL